MLKTALYQVDPLHQSNYSFLGRTHVSNSFLLTPSSLYTLRAVSDHRVPDSVSGIIRRVDLNPQAEALERKRKVQAEANRRESIGQREAAARANAQIIVDVTDS